MPDFSESNSIPLATRKGRPIENEQCLDVPPFKSEMLIASMHRRYRFVHMRRPPAGLYNCHGLTFACRRTCVGILNPKSIETILDDDGYRQIGAAFIETGDTLVCYDGSEISHSGIVTHVDRGDLATGVFAVVYVCSKWGQESEYIHMVNQGPYAQHRITYWTDRP